MARLLSNYIFFASSILFLNSCFLRDAIIYPECSGDCAEVSGIILTGDGTEPVEDVLIKLRWYDYIYGSLVKDDIVAKIKTNHNGFYKLKFDAKTEGHYEVIIENNDDYYSLFDKEFHEFGLPDMTNDSLITRNYMMPLKAKLIVEFDGYATIENPYSLDVTFPLGIDFNQANGYALSWDESRSEYKYEMEVAAEVPITLRKTIVINDTTFLYQYDTIFIQRHELYKYDLCFQQN